MAKILLFQDDGEREYVVIQEDMEAPTEDFAEPGFTLKDSLEVEGDPYRFPTDRSLSPR